MKYIHMTNFGTSIEELKQMESQEIPTFQGSSRGPAQGVDPRPIPFQHPYTGTGRQPNQPGQSVPQNDDDLDTLIDSINDKKLESMDDTAPTTTISTSDMNKLTMMKSVISFLKDPLIILVLFILLSQPFVKTTIAKYVPQILPQPGSSVGQVGILLYGLILVVLFMIVRQIVG